MTTSKNEELLTEFKEYCEAHPEQRFWQALRNWNLQNNPNESYIFVGELPYGEMKFFDKLTDTFFRE